MPARIRSTLAIATTLVLAAAAAIAPPPAAVAEERVERRVVVRGVGEGPEDLEWQVIELGDEGPARLFAAERGYLGVALVEMTPELRVHLGAPEDAGVLISKVEPASPAARAGVQVGDVLGAIDGESVRTVRQVTATIGERREGDAAVLEIWRAGKVIKLSATLEQRRRQQVELGRLLRRIEGLPTLEELPRGAIAIDVEKVDDAVREMVERMRDPEWEDRLRSMQRHRAGLLERIDVLEKRLAELEKKLAELPE